MSLNLLSDPHGELDKISRIESYDEKITALSDFLNVLNMIVKVSKSPKISLEKSLQIMTDTHSTFSYSNPNLSALQIMIEYSKGKRTLAIGSRNGFWEKLFEILGGIIIPTDPNIDEELLKFHDGILQYDAVEAVKKFATEVLFMSWPEEGTYAYDGLLEFKGDTFFFIGECRGGSTADNSFFDLLEKEWVLEKDIELEQWLNIHDGLSIYKRANLHVNILDEEESSEDESSEDESSEEEP